MNEFEIQQIENAFKRCFGLQSAVKRSVEDELLQRAVVESLSYQSGLRRDFIKNNLEQIAQL